jgi:hypothetical protein
VKTIRSIALLGFFFVAVSAVYADGIPDPRIVIGGDLASNPVGANFTFQSTATGGGFFQFYNATNDVWTSLLITMPVPYSQSSQLPLISTLNYTIESDLFTHATFWVDYGIQQQPTAVNILFEAGEFLNNSSYSLFNALNCPSDLGIQPGGHFYVNLFDNPYTGGGGWLGLGGQTLGFDAGANPDINPPAGALTFLTQPISAPPPIPEPSTLALLFGGLCVTAVRFFCKRH